MIILDVEQGSYEWQIARAGIPTASCFDRILTPKTLKLSAQSVAYRNELLAEWLLGEPIEAPTTYWMERGTIIEPEARAFYELQSGATVRTVGLVLRADRKVGGSPDALVGDAGGLELKCPAPQTHVGYMLDPAAFAATYRHQVQGNLYLTGRQWWDLQSYCPGLPAVTQRIERDEVYLAALDAALRVFLADLDAMKEQLSEYRAAPRAPQAA